MSSVLDYFARNDAKVGARCLAVQVRFMVPVEFESLRRFPYRFPYSRIVETSLISHVE